MADIEKQDAIDNEPNFIRGEDREVFDDRFNYRFNRLLTADEIEYLKNIKYDFDEVKS